MQNETLNQELKSQSRNEDLYLKGKEIRNGNDRFDTHNIILNALDEFYKIACQTYLPPIIFSDIKESITKFLEYLFEDVNCMEDNKSSDISKFISVNELICMIRHHSIGKESKIEEFFINQVIKMEK